MRRLPPVALLFVFVTLPSCDLLGGDSERTFPEPRLYAHDLFPNEQACLDAQPPDPFFINCQQWLTLCPDGEAQLVETDIIFPATYGISGDRLTVAVNQDRIRFRVAPDEEVLTRIDNGTEWARQIPEFPLGCGDS